MMIPIGFDSLLSVKCIKIGFMEKFLMVGEIAVLTEHISWLVFRLAAWCNWLASGSATDLMAPSICVILDLCILLLKKNHESNHKYVQKLPKLLENSKSGRRTSIVTLAERT